MNDNTAGSQGTLTIALFRYINPDHAVLLTLEIVVAPHRAGLYVGLLLMTTEILEKREIIILEHCFTNGGTRDNGGT